MLSVSMVKKVLLKNVATELMYCKLNKKLLIL